ncbi:NAD(P)H-binding protein [Staphylococcus ursi]|uniref:NAD(P)H-binding protein n=1 Tax=Staphylococcus sp. MI 10-1553 TaxID=1912064 RepID=UPI001397F455|nr:NAD(P)H-binding protein [Staphylococcus sp. MI 10-1553]QHW37913.1 NAD(P)H-binding protein [Staphylococcus sp. MI 10-1553]
MKPNVLLAGGTGYIGKTLIHTLAERCCIHTISKYPKNQAHSAVNWIEADIYNYLDVLRAMRDIDIAVYFLDPTKHSAKMTRALAKDLNMIAADNFGRAAAQQGVKEIIYVKGSQFDDETIQQLGVYGVPVRFTSKQINRPHISVEFQGAKYNDIRLVHHIPKPLKWPLDSFIHQMGVWLTQTPGTRVSIRYVNHQIEVYDKKQKRLLMVFEMNKIDNMLYRLKLIKGRIAKVKDGKHAIIEFRYIQQLDVVIVHLFDYIPRAWWPVSYFIQVPFFQMLVRGFDTKCRIQNYYDRQQNGEDLHYTKE